MFAPRLAPPQRALAPVAPGDEPPALIADEQLESRRRETDGEMSRQEQRELRMAMAASMIDPEEEERRRDAERARMLLLRAGPRRPQLGAAVRRVARDVFDPRSADGCCCCPCSRQRLMRLLLLLMLTLTAAPSSCSRNVVTSASSTSGFMTRGVPELRVRGCRATRPAQVHTRGPPPPFSSRRVWIPEVSKFLQLVLTPQVSLP